MSKPNVKLILGSMSRLSSSWAPLRTPAAGVQSGAGAWRGVLGAAAGAAAASGGGVGGGWGPAARLL
jgi:hypothetical protein